MKQLRLTFIALCLFLPIHIQAQEVFKVLFNKSCEISSCTDRIKAGTKIFSEDTITIPEGGYLALVHTSGQAIELTTEGTFKAIDIASKLGTKICHHNKKNTAELIYKLTNINNNLNQKQEYDLNSRVSCPQGYIQLNIPPRANFINPEIIVTWHHKFKYNPDNYQVILTTLQEEILIKKTVSDTIFTFDLSPYEPTIVDGFHLKVLSKSNSSIYSCTNFLSFRLLEHANDIKVKLKRLKEEINYDSTSALSNLLIATFLDDNEVHIDAIDYYQKAIKVQPEIRGYKKIYNEFLKQKVYQFSIADR